MAEGAIIEAPALGHDELHLSHVSRTAAFNGLPNARELCLDFGLRFDPLVRGDAKQIALYAKLTATDLHTLSRNAVVWGRRGHFTINGEQLISQVSRLTNLHVCPECLAEDIEANPTLSPAAAVYWRRDWAVAGIETCAMHDRGIIFFTRQVGGNRDHFDTSLTADEVGYELPRLLEAAPRRRLSAAEAYFRARLDGNAPHLDRLADLPLHAAITVCAGLGQILTDPAGERREAATTSDRHAVIRDGFALLLADTTTLHDTLVRQLIQSPRAKETARVARVAMVGKRHKPTALPKLVGILDDAMAEASPLHHPYTKRMPTADAARLASVHKLARLHRISERKVLATAEAFGLCEQRTASDGKIVTFISAEEFARYHDEGRGIVNQRVARELLGASLNEFEMLRSTGRLAPVSKAGANGGSLRYRRMDVEAVCTQLREAAPLVEQMPAGSATLETAWRSIHRSSAFVLDCILSGVIKAASLPGGPPIPALLVDLEELWQCREKKPPLNETTRRTQKTTTE